MRKVNSNRVPNTKMTQKTIQTSNLELYDTLGVVVAMALNMAARVSRVVIPIVTLQCHRERQSKLQSLLQT